MADSVLPRVRIVRATRPDPQGGNPKHRSWVVVTDVDTDGYFYGVAVSSIIPQGEEVAKSVPLPWDRKFGGHRKTGFFKECWAMCFWLDWFHIDEIAEDDLGGHVPGATLERILNILDEIA